MDAVGVDEFCRRRLEAEDMPLKLMRALREAPLVDEEQIDRMRAGTLVQWTEDRQETLQLAADGLLDREIAERRVESLEAVKSRVRTIMAFLGARNRAHAIHLAHKKGLL